MEILNIHAPIKFKYIRANNNLFMTKDLRKATKQRSKLRNRLNRLKTPEANVGYKRQRNYCTSLLRRAKRDFFEKLNPNAISDNKMFWKIVKPLFSDKVPATPKITLCENEEIHDNDAQVAEGFGHFFSTIVTELNIGNRYNHFLSFHDNVPILNHPSILKINEIVKNGDSFSFIHIDEDMVRKEISLLGASKASPKHLFHQT